LTVGEYIGVRLKHWVLLKRINSFDNGLGSILSVVSMLLSVWLIASILNSSSVPVLQMAIRSSRIIAQLNRRLPTAPTVIAKLSHLVDPNGFPDVFIGNEPIPPSHINLPALGDLATAVNEDKNSVVRIRGEGCGGIVSGSGFVVSTTASQSYDLVATNAHVVAGIAEPYVQDANGSHRATVIWFDPNLDFAVLRVSGLTAHSLSIANNPVAAGTPAVVLGYPGGGSFAADPAAVLGTINAVGRNIYGTGHTLRDIYEVRADIIPGNSGGPLVAQDGSVIGVVFAESTTYNHVGYALTTPKITSEINQASSHIQAVSTGQCAE
jgi:S1-C subfamily serine protease